MRSSTSHHLSPVIGLGRLIGLTFAVIAPASSVFLTYGTAYEAAGTGIVLGYASGALVNLALMFCYAELGSRYAEAGGDYALAARALGRPAGSLYAVLFAIKGIAIPGLLSLSTATYLHQLWPAVPSTPAATAIFLIYMLLASINLRTSSLMVNIMVLIELSVFALFIIAASSHLHQPASILWHPLRASSQGVIPVTPKAWLGAATAALYGLNGPQASIYYSEETLTSPKQIGRTIFGAALVTATIELVGVILGTLALPHLAVAHRALPSLFIDALGRMIIRHKYFAEGLIIAFHRGLVLFLHEAGGHLLN